MPTPQDQSKKLSGGGPPGYCGVCGLPDALCACADYELKGVKGAVKAGSASADIGPPAKGLKSEGAALPFGKKKE